MTDPSEIRLAWTFVAAGVALAGAGLLLYITFLGLLPGAPTASDQIAAVTNIVVLATGVGLACAGESMIHRARGPLR